MLYARMLGEFGTQLARASVHVRFCSGLAGQAVALYVVSCMTHRVFCWLLHTSTYMRWDGMQKRALTSIYGSAENRVCVPG